MFNLHSQKGSINKWMADRESPYHLSQWHNSNETDTICLHEEWENPQEVLVIKRFTTDNF